MRPSRPHLALITILLLLSTSLLPAGSFAARQPTGSGIASPTAPRVTGADYTLKGAQFNDARSDAKEKSLKNNLTLPSDARDATFTSDPTKAPMDFSDVAPRWWSDTPSDTAVAIELRTSRDGQNWDEWQSANDEDILSPQDTITQTFGGMISVNQTDRTHRYVQSRVTLHADKPGVTPTFHELTYTFINAGVTANPPRPQAMIMGTPAEAPKPALVSRVDWGSPDGKGSPDWTPKYRRVTHIVIHHTATSNNDTDFAARVRAIWYYHAHTRDWGDLGYNYLIDPNGVIYEGRAGGDDVEAGHAYPFNSATMGVGIIGSFMKVAPSASAQSALIDLISWKVSQRGIDPQGVAPITGYTNCGGTLTYERPTIDGHRDFKGTACGRTFNTSSCPGDKLWNLLPEIRAAVIANQPALRAVFTKHDTPGNLEPGAAVDVHLTVRNTGSLTWPATGQGAVSLGYRWYTPDGKPVKVGASHGSPLPRNVPFADTITITARLNAPAQPGHYAVMWDMTQDGQGWFADQGSKPLKVDVVIGKTKGDIAPPTSSVLPLPVYSNSPDIVVRWAGKDEAKGSGIVSYDIQYRTMPQGQWTDWKSATTDTQATFDEGQDGYTYGFRSRARDAAGNVEAFPDDPDAYTTVDTKPPLLVVDTPTNGSYVQPGPLLVRGHTEPGTYVAINDKRADEAAGVFTSTVEAAGRDFVIHITAADHAGNISRLEITVQAAQRYSDVPMSHPAFIAIEYLSDQGIINGYDDATFRPDDPVSRAQTAKVLATALHWGLIRPPEPRFTDVDFTSWMYPYVETAAARSAIDGYEDGTFHPNANISHASIVQSIVKAAGWKLITTKAGHFADLRRGPQLFNYVETAYAHGIITPDEGGNFNPSKPTTRAAVSAMIYGLLADMIPANPPPPPEEQGP